MKKLLIAGLAIIGVVLAAVLALPGFVDWNAYRGEIAARIAAATGRAVELNGDIGLSLLPAPELSVADARLANPTGYGLPDMVRLKRLDVKVALLPLLGGRVQVESVTLVEPVFTVEITGDGRLNWDLRGPAPGGEADGQGGGFTPAVSFDRIEVEDGRILFRDARNGREEAVEHVDARVVAGSFAGPFQIQGGLRVRGVPVLAEVTAGRFAAGAAVPVRAAFTLPDAEATLRFAGIVNSDSDGRVRAQGDLRMEGADLATAAKPFGLATLPVRTGRQPFALRAAVEAKPGTVEFGGLEVQLGDTRAAGSARFDGGKAVPSAELALTVNRLDLDAWAAPARAGAAPAAAAEGTAPADPPAGGFALPHGLTATADLTVDAITYNGGLVRQVRLEAALKDGVVTLERAGALLPGGSDVVAAGTVGAVNGHPAVDLRLEANADNLRGLLEWLKVDVAGVPPDRLRKASVAARVQGRPGRFDVTGIDLRVDTSLITGGIAYADRGRPAFGVQLDVDRLSLDAYVPKGLSGAASGAAVPAAPPAKTARSGAAEGPLGLLQRVDVNLQLTVGTLVARSVPVQTLRLDATATDGALVVKEVSVGDLAGMSATVSGAAAALFPLRNAHLTVSARAATLSGLTRVAEWPSGAPEPERLGPVTLDARVAGDAGRVAVEATLAAAGGTVEGGGTIVDPMGTPLAELKLRTTHPDLGQLLAVFDPAAADSRQGAFDLYAEMKAGPKRVTLSGMQGTVAGTAVRGAIDVALDTARPRLRAEVQTGDLDLDRWTAQPAAARGSPAGTRLAAEAAATAPIDLGWLRRFDGSLALTAASATMGGMTLENPALKASLADGVLVLDQLDGGFMGGQLGATGRLTVADAAAPAAEVDLTVVKAKPAASNGALALAGGSVDLDLALTTAGASRAAMLRELAGNGRLAARGGVLRGIDIAAVAERLARIDRPQDLVTALSTGIQGGATPFASLDGTFTVAAGVVRSDDLRLTADAGQAIATGRVDVPAGTIDLTARVAVTGVEGMPPLGLRLTGPLEQPDRALDLGAVREFLARRAAGAVVDRAAPQGAPGLSQPQEVIRGLLDTLRR